jgi:8-oxo-dGTP pyrophosphatase MutT (NUDIX family)
VKEELKGILSRRKKQRIIDSSLTSAAVLVPIYEKEREYYILFIKRTEWVGSHKGEISFPGGVHEAQDRTLLDTALREAMEEIDLSPDRVEVLGELDDETSAKTRYAITPFLAFISWPCPLRVDGRETEEMIEVPLRELLGKGYTRSEQRDGKRATIYFYDYEGRTIWGATARILHTFLDIFAKACGATKKEKP